MYRHVRHLVNTCQVKSLMYDWELLSFQGICPESTITECKVEESVHCGEKLERSWGWIEGAAHFYSVHIFICKEQHKAWNKKNPIVFFCPPILMTCYATSSWCILGANWREEGKARGGGWTSGTGQLASSRGASMAQEGRWREQKSAGPEQEPGCLLFFSDIRNASDFSGLWQEWMRFADFMACSNVITCFWRN